MYAAAKAAALAPYAHAVEGDMDAAACVIHAAPLSDAARGALAAACAGIGMPDPVFLDCMVLGAIGGDSDVDAARRARSLFEAVEALDPVMTAVVDAAAAEAMGRAYREPVTPDGWGFVFGRPYAAFSHFQDDLVDVRLKQRDWAVFKALRKNAPWMFQG